MPWLRMFVSREAASGWTRMDVIASLRQSKGRGARPQLHLVEYNAAGARRMRKAVEAFADLVRCTAACNHAYDGGPALSPWDLAPCSPAPPRGHVL